MVSIKISGKVSRNLAQPELACTLDNVALPGAVLGKSQRPNIASFPEKKIHVDPPCHGLNIRGRIPVHVVEEYPGGTNQIETCPSSFGAE